jgi:hypothetical protein
MVQTSARVAELEPLLEKVTHASVVLRHSKDRVPEEVTQLVGTFETELRARESVFPESDPSRVNQLLFSALGAEKALHAGSALEQRQELRVALEQMRVFLTEIIEDAPYALDVSIGDVLHNLVEVLQVPQRDIAGLLGITPRSLGRWLEPGWSGPSRGREDRLRLVAQLVNQLRHSLTPDGVVRWFYRVHPELHDRPIDLLDSDPRRPDLFRVARRGRYAP